MQSCVIPKTSISEDDLMSLVLDAGAEDMATQNDVYEITTDPMQFEAVHKAIEEKGIKPEPAEVGWFPMSPVPVTDTSTAKAVLALIEALEENDDVQNVHANCEIPDDLIRG